LRCDDRRVLERRQVNGLAALGEVGWVDWGLLAVLAVSVLAGLVRGLVFEVLSLMGWVVGWFAALWFAADLAPHLPVGEAGSKLNLAAAFAACFVATVIVWAICARLVRLLLHTTPLTSIDRLLGAGFGFVRGAVLLLVVAAVVGLTPASQSSDWQRSLGAAWLQATVDGLKPWLPPQTRRLLPSRPDSTA
jgi:membrane protein required for colicin V production